MSDLWFPGTDRSHPAPFDGGSILGGNPKCLWHVTVTDGLPSYSTGYFPNMTISPNSGHTWQHIPANRAARALRNESGGVQTNRWNVFQVEIIGQVNTVPFHPVMAEIAQWLHEVRGTPLQATSDWLPYDASYGTTRVRFSAAEWATFSGHCGHMHAPENDHGDPGWPFPIDQIIAGQEAEDMTVDELDAYLRSTKGQATIRAALKTDLDAIKAHYPALARGEINGVIDQASSHYEDSHRGLHRHLGLVYEALARGEINGVIDETTTHYQDSNRAIYQVVERLRDALFVEGPPE